jgi:hypothetical protein
MLWKRENVVSFCITLCSVPFPVADLPNDLYGRPDGSIPGHTVDKVPNDRLRPLGHAITVIEFFEGEDHKGEPMQLDRFAPSAGELRDSLRQEKVDLVEDRQPIPPIFGPIGWLNILVQATPAITGALGAVLGAWLQQRGNRRLRIKVGEKEFEARTTDELECLIHMASQIEPNHDYRDRESRIADLAHQLWILRGRPSGSPEVDWSRAEELMLKFGR